MFPCMYSKISAMVCTIDFWKSIPRVFWSSPFLLSVIWVVFFSPCLTSGLLVTSSFLPGRLMLACLVVSDFVNRSRQRDMSSTSDPKIIKNFTLKEDGWVFRLRYLWRCRAFSCWINLNSAIFENATLKSKLSQENQNRYWITLSCPKWYASLTLGIPI